jgi:hypothetical protein
MSDATPDPDRHDRRASPDTTDKAAAEPAASGQAAAEPAAFDKAAAEPAAAQAGPADEPAAGQPRPAGARWWNRRVPLLVTAATLLLGCVLGAGVVAVGALAVAVGGHGDDRGHSNRDERGFGWGNEGGERDGVRRPGRGDRRDRIAPTPSTPSPRRVSPN